MDKYTLRLPVGYAHDTPVLVAFSGGADSALLLHLLHRAGIRLYAAHVHHGIRGAEADADLNFCRHTCRKLGIPLFAIRINAPALAKKSGQSVETAAREARYRHFARLMKKHGIPLLATAHHADDNLETLLFRICRGTGTQGLCGIPALAELPCAHKARDLHVFRPLLHLTKCEILDACNAFGIDFVTDATNACDDYARNRIRNRVVPELETLFHHPQHAAARLCRAVREDRDALDSLTDTLYNTHAKGGTLPLTVLQAQPAAISKRLITRLYASASDSMAEQVHIDAVYTLVRKGQPGSISLPDDLCAVLDRDALRILPRNRTQPPPYCLPLQQGFYPIPNTDVAIWCLQGGDFEKNQETVTKDATNVYNLYTELQVRFDTIKGRVFLRPLKEGDRILQGGMHKKVRKLYNQFSTPLYLRSTLPLLCDEEGVLAVPAICLRDGAAPFDAQDKLCVRIYLRNHLNI
ncbi:MAG: tRNA lysidine(34) synthetase TilS [Clostridia bacterium]|nr:tRNA lysidine(34) synthetase TilS [Clostridia bacterium]